MEGVLTALRKEYVFLLTYSVTRLIRLVRPSVLGALKKDTR